MHAPLYIDPRIRDFVFIPLIVLMVVVQIMRIFAMKYMNEPKNRMLEPAKMGYRTLNGTLFEADADLTREMPEQQNQIDIPKLLDTTEDSNAREIQALARSGRVRKNAEFLPESAVKTRKQYFTKEKDGYLLNDKVSAGGMNMMAGSPDMMNGMLKQNF